MIDPKEFWLLAPEIFLAVAAMLLLVAGSIGRGVRNRPAVAVALMSLAATAILVLWAQGKAGGGEAFLGGMFILDSYALFVKMLLLLATGLTVAISGRFLEEGGYRPGEYYSLILFAATGMLFMASGYSLLSIWISLELMALSSYILAGYFKRERKSNEAALKYFILGAFSSVRLLKSELGHFSPDAVKRLERISDLHALTVHETTPRRRGGSPLDLSLVPCVTEGLVGKGPLPQSDPNSPA